MNVACCTHEGRVRTENEDSVFVDGKKTPVVAILADGMGGHAGGKQASSLTIKYIRKRLRELGNLSAVTKEQLCCLVEDASEHLRAEAEKDERMRGMGTTLVLALIDTTSAKIAAIGDSRAYLYTDGVLRQITKDHSYVQYLYDHNLMTREEMRTHPYRNIIMRAVGMEDAQADGYEVALKRGDAVLLCSDGLTEELEDDEIAEVLEQNIPAKKKTEQLTARALKHGGRDNISVALIENKGIIGAVLQDKYEIREMIAEGGMSRVYRGVCTRTGMEVAVKIFKTEFLNVPQAVEGFKQEARAAAMLHHPNLQHAIDVGKLGKLRYIVSEYIPGVELKSMLRTLSLTQSVEIAKSILAGIGYAHNRGVVHRDLKPNNILMDGEKPVIIDFGIAAIPAEQDEQNECVLATVDYFSPEQAMNERVDARSDIYSIGVMLYEMCTGKLPFEGTDEIQIALKHMHQPVQPPRELNPEIPESLNRIILKALEKRPQDRYPNAAAMRRDLELVFAQPDGEYVKLHQEQERREARSKMTAMFVAIGVICTVMLTAAVLMVRYVGKIGKSNPTTEAVYMPYLLDKNEQDARELLEGYSVTVDYEVVPETAAGSVIEQSPEAGTVIEKTDQLHITVCAEDIREDG